MHGAYGGYKREADALELELETIMSSHMNAWIQTSVSISTAPSPYFKGHFSIHFRDKLTPCPAARLCPYWLTYPAKNGFTKIKSLSQCSLRLTQSKMLNYEKRNQGQVEREQSRLAGQLSGYSQTQGKQKSGGSMMHLGSSCIST